MMDEKIWDEAGRRALGTPDKTQTDHYFDILMEKGRISKEEREKYKPP